MRHVQSVLVRFPRDSHCCIVFESNEQLKRNGLFLYILYHFHSNVLFIRYKDLDMTGDTVAVWFGE